MIGFNERITAIILCTAGINIFDPRAFNLQRQRFIAILHELAILCE
jgi:hypothetical protein